MTDQRQRWQRFLPLQPQQPEPAMRPRRSAETRTFRVGTFCHNTPGRRPLVTAATRMFGEAWAGCVVFEVEADSADEARKIAVARRREMEERDAEAD